MNNRKKTINIKHWITISIFSIGVLSSYTNFVFTFGRFVESRKTGIALKNEFSLLAENLQNGEINPSEQSVKLQNVYLVKYPESQLSGNKKIIYKIHQITDDALKIRRIGSISTNSNKVETGQALGSFLESIKESTLGVISNFSIIEKAYAQTTFKWNGYEKNYDFDEEYIDQNTVRRTYYDGAILEYKIDSKGSSIPTSFRWIKQPS